MSDKTYFSNLSNLLKAKFVDYYNILDDFNVLGRVNSRKNTTLLIPSKKLTESIKSNLAEAECDKQIKIIHGLNNTVIYEAVDSLDELKNGTFKVPNDKMLTFKGLNASCKLQSLDNYVLRCSDNKELSIKLYEIDGSLPYENVSTDSKNVKAKKGGAVISKVRSELYESVVKAKYARKEKGSTLDPYLEILVSLLQYAENESKDANLLPLLRSQLSSDTAATLNIVLQPYKTSGVQYISDSDLEQFSAKYSDASTELYSYKKDLIKCYTEHMQLGCLDDATATIIRNSFVELRNNLSATNDSEQQLSNLIGKTYNSLNSKINIPSKRKQLLSVPAEALAEAELRTIHGLSQLCHDNFEDEINFYKYRYNLNKPGLMPSPTKLGGNGSSNNDILNYMKMYVPVSVVSGDAFLYFPGLVVYDSNKKNSYHDMRIPVTFKIDSVNKWQLYTSNLNNLSDLEPSYAKYFEAVSRLE